MYSAKSFTPNEQLKIPTTILPWMNSVLPVQCSSYSSIVTRLALIGSSIVGLLSFRNNRLEDGRRPRVFLPLC
jgi:hypothetical protein